MQDTQILTGKKILIVDDEPDILESLEDILDMCTVDSASDYNTAEQLINNNMYDAAVLDVMGVRGYDLLELANYKGIPVIILTSHALSVENLITSVEKGAKAYIPKDKISDIEIYLSDIVIDKQENNSKFGKWFDRLKIYFDNKFGTGWLDKHNNLS
ncbi:MAG: response regulator [Desulfobacterales bacterium]|nr:response regulator [Desulfobacterales bacterium]